MVSEKSSKFYFTNCLKYIKEIISIKLQYKFQFILVLNVAVTKRHIKRISPNTSLKRMTNIIYTYLVLGRDKTYLVKKNHLILLKLIQSQCLSYLLTTYLLCLVDVFFNRQPEFL